MLQPSHREKQQYSCSNAFPATTDLNKEFYRNFVCYASKVMEKSLIQYSYWYGFARKEQELMYKHGKNYEQFGRYLRTKYNTRTHVAEQLLDRLILEKKSVISINSNNRHFSTNAAIAAVELPSFDYLTLEQPATILKETTPLVNDQLETQFKPYFNECIKSAERIKINRRSDRDRQICYENLILVQKLIRIKNRVNKSNANLKTDYINHCQLLVQKANCKSGAMKLVKDRFPVKKLSSCTIVNDKSQHRKEAKLTTLGDRTHRTIGEEFCMFTMTKIQTYMLFL
ncbi:unnamed protein product [Didymodactylos carnosus]|uniref:Uncharacterized protein n=1 Tax=Didymodactylos carnosus TaxID=1234261 RepID=A0A8S2V8G0_9BILA|nr:unnamed protein product [Didymodactylos carnosus]CAF4385562.1 unnamed protein product [Didymodactylos carnosus]